MDTPEKILEEINNYTGLKLKLCPCFTGIHTRKRQKYINVETEHRRDMLVLRGLNSCPFVTKVEANGVTRLAVYIK